MSEPLPPGWIWATLDDVIVSMRNGISTKPVGVDGVPILRISAVRPNALDLTDRRYLDEEPAGEVDYSLHAGDLLFTRYNGTRSLVGVCAHVPEGVGRVVYPDKLIRVRVNEAVAYPRYVQFAANSGVSRAFIESRARTTAGQTGVSGGDLRAMPLPLPPLAEQRRIVAALEENLSALEAAVAGLTRARANADRLHLAVIEDVYRSAAASLECEWRTLDSLAAYAAYGTSQRCEYEAAGPGVLRIPNIANGQIDTRDLKRATEPGELLSSVSLDKGDFLVVRTNGSRDLIGRAALVLERPEQPLFFASYLIRYRLSCSFDEALWVSWLWRAPSVRSKLEALAASSAGQYNLSLGKLATVALPFPSTAQRVAGMANILRHVESIERVAAEIDVQLARAARLRQSILHRAFSGGLVPQDPEDEPADELLAGASALPSSHALPSSTSRARKRATTSRRAHG